MQFDIRVLELLSSKICHDLISPVSAINNGVELIQEIGDTVIDEAMKLIENSASLASKRLKLFRLAYGRAGSEETIKELDVRPVVESYFEGGKINLSWPEGTVTEESLQKQGLFKVLINFLLLGEELLAYGGTVAVRKNEEEEQVGLRIEISGRGVQISDVVKDALESRTTAQDLTPRTVQSYVTGAFARNFGFEFRFSQPLPERIDFLLMHNIV